ncbi:cell division protein FtsQ/DivIB [Breznakiella homolactica]|uniref:FtsQ-type POTRA domain-containing protein n=1 Tax=Breznakiella homolactica TaxID=2798577 RepID=A0A7T7XJK6_9SPIR|nr:FtsQ-type POTRA domain-containing protein [Breznakiella homolactica]QQO07402.1 FtsQ-type POTRA domain-containing protein [Breznakiella homolactica]
MMSSDYIYAEEQAGAAAHSRMDKILKRVLILLAVVLGVELVWLFGITPCMPFSKIEISGIPDLDRALVIAQAGITPESTFINMNAGKAEQALESLYMVESAVVHKRFPDTLRITLTPRTAVALAFAEVNGRLTPVFLDRHGVVFKIGAHDRELKNLASSLPIISGLVFENLNLGTRLPALFKGFLGDLERISLNNPGLLSAISEIRVQKKLYDGFELVLYPAHTPVRLRVGNELNEDMLRYMMLVIDVFDRQGVDTEEIDFRTGTAAFKVKEASSG